MRAWWAGRTGRERAEVAVLVVALLVFLVLWVFRIGPASLMLLPWLVVAAIAAHLLADRMDTEG